ncbi:lipase family alpha/beta hydrolase [Planktothrix mougeotii]|uniref:Alpha/beta fold hydrolase n=1 Tax=Planktothrix mougeotii LEGE 06226 TaxID=1828728 RepID=A0ABR9UEY0_9CYAN|nr:alpha/beta fold hydrolase [Planktothrix mougeotii]MBE9145020.1 alpha/beta fold hydrolase [Planktothrix mougeotii LEGE 06226]
MNNSTLRNPVLLIHGIFDTKAIFKTMTAHLTQRGWNVHSLNLIPNDGRLGLEILAKQVADYVTQTFPAEQPIDLIGFSMGGIVSRYYVQRLGGIERVQRFITISSPHHGTLTGYLYPTLAASQMRSNCPFLKDLNRDLETLDRINFTSIWTPYDSMIVPAQSSQMPIGQEFIVNVLVHSWMVSDLKCLVRVEEALNAPLKTLPTPVSPAMVSRHNG